MRKPRVKKKRARTLRRRSYRLRVRRQSQAPGTEIAQDAAVSLRLGWRKKKPAGKTR